MASINEKVINTQAVSVQTHNWKRYGNFLTDVIDALCEYIHNGYAAGLIARTRMISNDLKVQVEFKDNVLYVKNVGIPADLHKVLDYGKENHGTSLNQFGTGFKTATSYLNPSNDGWAFYTQNEHGVFRVKAPYSTKMEIEQLDVWPFESEFASCVVVSVENEEVQQELMNNKAMVKKLGYHYSFAISDGLNLQYNGIVVKKVLPKGEAQTNSYTMNIQGEDVHCEYALYKLNEDVSCDEEYYPASIKGQGVYVFVNNCLAVHAGTSVIALKDGKSSMKEHPSMNRCVALLNIIIPDDKRHLDIPFVNCKNAIDWRKKNGAEYKAAINDICGAFFRDIHDEATEKEKRKQLERFLPKFVGPLDAGYETEYRVSGPTNKRNEGLRADAVLGILNKDGKIDIEEAEITFRLRSPAVQGVR